MRNAECELRNMKTDKELADAAEEALRLIEIICTGQDPSEGEGKNPEEIVESVRGVVGVWSKELPTEQDSYWSWNGEDAPIHVEVFWSPTGCFLPAGQYGWTRAQDVSERGGWWAKLSPPPLPSI